jgi:ribosomal protein S20
MPAKKATRKAVKRTTLEQRLVNARERSKTATGIDKVLAAQDIRDLEAKIAQLNTASGADLKSLEAAFVKIAKRFGENRGIGYGAWRDAGVSAQVLRRAGVARTRG